MNGSDDTESDSVFELIEAGARGPIDVMYLIPSDYDLEDISSGLEDIARWGEMTGWWEVRFVRSLDEALTQLRQAPCEVLISLGISIEDSETIAREFPYLPQSIATPGGFDRFPSGWPPQVVVAQWAAPREGEFGDSLETALSRPVTEIIYEANNPGVEIFSGVSDELLARLAEQPQERFLVSPRLFEEAVAEILSRMGYDVQLTPASRDQGRDIIANLATPTSPLLMLVECKRYAPNRPVGVEPIARLWSRLFDDKANLALAITTSTFAPVAQRFARTRGYQIDLADGERFIDWIRALRIK